MGLEPTHFSISLLANSAKYLSNLPIFNADFGPAIAPHLRSGEHRLLFA
jgi:hypothetical protein